MSTDIYIQYHSHIMIILIMYSFELQGLDARTCMRYEQHTCVRVAWSMGSCRVAFGSFALPRSCRARCQYYSVCMLQGGEEGSTV